MEDHRIQKVLDDLDIQLAAGKIDLPTYQTLYQKWSSRLAAPDATVRAGTRPPAAVAVKLACPNCGAPLGERFAGTSQSYKCEYCSHTFEVRKAQEETEKLKRELQDWLSQLVSGGGAGGTIDATSRAFIFREKLYPSLQVEFDRAFEWLDGSREFPLFEIELGAYFPSYLLTASPLLVQREQLTAIRGLAGKLNVTAVRDFVVSPEDGKKLELMEVRARELMYAANILEQSRKFNAEGYATALQNISALKEVNEKAQNLAGGCAEKQFLQACFIRLQGTAAVLDVLSRIYQSTFGEIMGSTFRAELEAASRHYGEALSLCEVSNHSPTETVPWQHGVEKELSLVALESDLLACYERVVSNRRGTFFDFQSRLKQFIEASQAAVGDAQGLARLVESLTGVVEAKRGSRGLIRLADWTWLEPAIELHRKKSLLKFAGTDEQVQRTQPYWHPFWVADLSYSQSEGTFFKSGSTRHGLLLLDATSTRKILVSVVTQGSALYAMLQAKRESTDSTLALPVFVSEAAAQGVLDAYTRSSPSFRNPHVQIREVVYLPACDVTYQSKQGARRETVSTATVFESENDALHRATLSFATAYVS